MTGSIVPEKSLKGTIKSEGTLRGSIVSELKLTGKVTIPSGYNPYDGPYEVEPSDSEETILRTNGKSIDRDIVIKPIPKNYGRIIWDGISLKIV